MTLSRRAALTVPVVAAALALAACGNDDPAVSTSASGSAGAAGASGKATVGLTYIPNVQFAPFYVGIKEGDFTRRGVDVSVRHHGAQEGLFTALNGGQEQLLIAGGDELVQARAQGMDVVAVASYYRRYPVELVVPEGSAIRTPKDLVGKRLGLPGRYGASWLGALAMFKGAGIAAKDVDVTEIGYTSQAALAAGKVDAVMAFRNNEPVQMRLAGQKIREIPLTSTGSVPLVSISLVTTRAYYEAHKDTVKAVADGMLDGMQVMKDDPDKAMSDSKAFVPNLDDETTAKAARATLDATTAIMLGADGQVTGRLVPAQWDAMATFMRSQGLVDKAVPASRSVVTDAVSR